MIWFQCFIHFEEHFGRKQTADDSFIQSGYILECSKQTADDSFLSLKATFWTFGNVPNKQLMTLFWVWTLHFGIFQTNSWWLFFESEGWKFHSLWSPWLTTPFWVLSLKAEKKNCGRFYWMDLEFQHAFECIGSVLAPLFRKQDALSLFCILLPLFAFFFEWFRKSYFGVYYMSFLVGVEHHLQGLKMIVIHRLLLCLRGDV